MLAKLGEGRQVTLLGLLLYWDFPGIKNCQELRNRSKTAAPGWKARSPSPLEVISSSLPILFKLLVFVDFSTLFSTTYIYRGGTPAKYI